MTATDLTITRSLTTVAVAIFIMVMLLGMALAILGVTLSVLAFGQKLDLPILALSGALMFGFVAFRNAMPGTPPIGSLSDYLSFFWAEGIVASCLFALAVHYLRGLHRAAS